MDQGGRRPRRRPAWPGGGWPRTGAGLAAACALLAALSVALLPLRAGISASTVALILVVPVVVGVVAGGVLAGMGTVVVVFLAWLWLFVPPYSSLWIGDRKNWLTLVVDMVVTLIIARLVAVLDAARERAASREQDTRALVDLSWGLVADRPMPDLLAAIAASVVETFAMQQVSVTVADTAVSGAADAVVTAGDPTSPATLTCRVPLAASGHRLGELVCVGPPLAPHRRQLLDTYANHAAAAIEREALRERGRQVAELEQTDRLNKALLGAASHDLRTPLATIKSASSTLRDAGDGLAPAASAELVALIDDQADRLARMVTNVLDMGRLQAGAARPAVRVEQVGDLLGDLREALAPHARPRVVMAVPADLPAVAVDPTLVGQALVNVVDNAVRHAPPGTVVTVAATVAATVAGPDWVVVTVTDRGPGVPSAQREAVFDRFARGSASGTGLGLAIAAAFVEAHGGRIWVESQPGEGATFFFTLPKRSPAEQVPLP